MKHVWLVLLFAATGLAQTPVPSPTPATTSVAWDHDGVNVDSFKLLSDGAVVSTMPSTDRKAAFPALTPGMHTLVVQACNIAGCASSTPLVVRIVVVPSNPTNIRIEVQ